MHPPQGVKLLAWCEEREDFRQFFVRAIRGLTARSGNFGEDRLALLEGLLEKEAGGLTLEPCSVPTVAARPRPSIAKGRSSGWLPNLVASPKVASLASCRESTPAKS